MNVCACGLSEYGPPRRFLTRWGEVAIACCRACGLGRDLVEHNFGDLYSDEAGIYHTPTEDFFAGQVRRVAPYVQFLGEHITRRGPALDIGCNSGFLLEALAQDGWSPAGIELNPSVAAYARTRGLDVAGSPLGPESFGGRCFDLISVSHVLEHLTDINAFLDQVVRTLQPGGYFFAAVPNYGSVLSIAIMGANWNGFIPGQHIWYFDKTSLVALCARHALRRLAVRTLVSMGTGSRKPFGHAVKIAARAGMRALDSGEEILSLFQKV